MTDIFFPQVGFGTCKHRYENPIDDIVLAAIEAGYRYFDTASIYETERDIGRAIKLSGLKRSELTIATKVWHDELGYQSTKDAFKRSLDRLDTDYVDLYLVHWPRGLNDQDWRKTLAETWKAMEELKEQGLIKALGVSNFLPHHLEELKKTANVKPVVDQLELHIGYSQEYAVRYLKDNDIKIQAWSPVGRGKDVFTNNKVITDMAERYNVSIQKLSLGFLVKKGIMPLVWTTDGSHMRENLAVSDFELSDEDISILSTMPQETWLGEHPDFYIPNKHTNLNQ